MIRFLGDACLAEYIVAGCLRREPTIDFQTALAAGLKGKTDPEVLTLAAEAGRILVTQDVRTMPRLGDRRFRQRFPSRVNGCAKIAGGLGSGVICCGTRPSWP